MNNSIVNKRDDCGSEGGTASAVARGSFQAAPEESQVASDASTSEESRMASDASTHSADTGDFDATESSSGSPTTAHVEGDREVESDTDGSAGSN